LQIRHHNIVPGHLSGTTTFNMLWLHAKPADRLSLASLCRCRTIRRRYCREGEYRQIGFQIPRHTIIGIRPAVAGAPLQRLGGFDHRPAGAPTIHRRGRTPDKIIADGRSG
jgi:hypothetical protein